MWNGVLLVLRSSEFWTALAAAIIEVAHEPVPGGDVTKVVLILYSIVRVVSKVLKYVFPNPTNPSGAWLKNDATPAPPTEGGTP